MPQAWTVDLSLKAVNCVVCNMVILWLTEGTENHYRYVSRTNYNL